MPETMTAADTVAAAIEKLEAAQLAHKPGPYLELNVSLANLRWFEWAAENLLRDRRTIAAQLGVLRAGRTAFDTGFFPEDDNLPGWVAEARALSLPLARAVIGEG